MAQQQPVRWTQCLARPRAVLTGLCLSVAVGLAAAQSAESPEDDAGLIITAESNLVVVPLHVYRKNDSVNGLGREAFELLEDGVVQDIAFVEGPSETPGESRTVPTEIIFLIDFSYSVMQPGLLDLTTVRSAMLEGLRQDVLISVYGFAANLKRFTGPTRDLNKLQRAFDNAYASEAGGSRVYEAIMQTARDAASRGGNVSRMMVVFSDGLSTTKLDPQLVVGAANAFGIPIYPVILGHDRIVARAQGRRGFSGFGGRHPNFGNNREQGPAGTPNRNPNLGNRQSNARSQENLMRIFAEIGRKTGGRSYDLEVLNNKTIRRVLETLATLAETEYVVGYYPRSVDEELTPHQVEVRLVGDGGGQLYGGRRTVVH